MTVRTKDEQKSYLDGFEMCADCIEKYLTDEGKQRIECLLMSVRNAVEIEDIEQQSCEDCISREQAKDAMYALCDETETLEDNPWRENPHIDAIIDEIDNLPSVTPKAEQKAVLSKIRAEIEQLTSRYSISKERGGMGIVEWSDRLIKESDVLQTIDKYRAESEEER